MQKPETIEAVYIRTHTISLDKGIFASIYTQKNNIIDKKINRASLFMCFNCVCNFNI